MLNQLGCLACHFRFLRNLQLIRGLDLVRSCCGIRCLNALGSIYRLGTMDTMNFHQLSLREDVAICGRNYL
ncbi:MAG: hypothetical protein VB817_12485, partial [Pirellulaceae bacterium]